MISLTLTMLLGLAAASPASQDYATAYQQTVETGRPLVVLIGADWCPGCRQMKQAAIPEVERQGGLRKVAYAYVNSDLQPKLAGQLMNGGSIPAVDPVSQDRRRLAPATTCGRSVSHRNPGLSEQ